MSHAADKLRALLMQRQFVSVEDFAELDGIGSRRAVDMLDSWHQHGRVTRTDTDHGPLYSEADPIPGIRRVYGHPWLSKPKPKPPQASPPTTEADNMASLVQQVLDDLEQHPWTTSTDLAARIGRSPSSTLSRLKIEGRVVCMADPDGDGRRQLWSVAGAAPHSATAEPLAESMAESMAESVDQELEDVDAAEQRAYEDAYAEGQHDLIERIRALAQVHRDAAASFEDQIERELRKIAEAQDSIRMTRIEQMAAARMAAELEALADGAL